MKIGIIIGVAMLLVLAACTTTPAADNETTPLEPEVTPEEPVETPDEPVEIPEEPEEEVELEPEELPETEDYEAVIEVVEGELVTLQTKATDPDGDEVTLSFGDPFNEEGEWQTSAGDAGRYEVTVTASDGKSETEALLLVLVNSANGAPEITGPETISVLEGEGVDLGVFTIVDPDGDDFITSYAGWMSGSTYTTNFDDAGNHEVTIIAEDSEGNSAEFVVMVEVENKNRKPRLIIEDRTIEGIEGDTIVIMAEGSDADEDEVTITYEEPFDEDGRWDTTTGDEGEYDITVTASDGEDQVSRTVRVLIEPENRAPVISINPIVVSEGETIDLEEASIEDPEGDDFTVTYDGWMDESTYTTTYDDAGEYTVIITAEDEKGATNSVTVEIVVEDVNRPPVFIRPA